MGKRSSLLVLLQQRDSSCDIKAGIDCLYNAKISKLEGFTRRANYKGPELTKRRIHVALLDEKKRKERKDTKRKQISEIDTACRSEDRSGNRSVSIQGRICFEGTRLPRIFAVNTY